MKILVKDDWSIFRIGICALICEHLNEIHPVECSETANLFEQVVSSECDLVIINFRAEPIEVAAQLHLFRQNFPRLPVIVIDFGGEKHNGVNTFFVDGDCTLEDLRVCMENITGKKISYK